MGFLNPWFRLLSINKLFWVKSLTKAYFASTDEVKPLEAKINPRTRGEEE